jgi:hypothetical protein
MERMGEQGHGEDGDYTRLLVRAEPLEQAEQVCRRMVATRVLSTDDALELEVDPAWAWAIKAVLAEKKVWVKEIRTQTTAERLIA